MAEIAGAGDAQRHVCGAGDRDCIGDLCGIEPQRLSCCGGSGESTLGCVIESLSAHRRNIGETGVNLVGDGERGQELCAARVDALGCGEHRTEVVGGVVGFTLREVRIHEIEVAAERAVKERCTVWAGFTAADQGCFRASPEVVEQAADRDNRLRIERADCNTEGVKHSDL